MVITEKGNAMIIERYKFSVWINSIGQSFDVIIHSDSYYHAEIQAKAQYPNAYKIISCGRVF